MYQGDIGPVGPTGPLGVKGEQGDKGEKVNYKRGILHKITQLVCCIKKGASLIQLKTLKVFNVQGNPGFGVPGQQGPKGENGERVSLKLSTCVAVGENTTTASDVCCCLGIGQGNVGLSGKPGPKVSYN